MKQIATEIDEDLFTRFVVYVAQEKIKKKMTQKIAITRALEEFLDREEKDEVRV